MHGTRSRGIVRGYRSADFWSISPSENKHVIFGFRPVLEPLVSNLSEAPVGGNIKVFGPDGETIKGCLVGYDDYDLVLSTEVKSSFGWVTRQDKQFLISKKKRSSALEIWNVEASAGWDFPGLLFQCHRGITGGTSLGHPHTNALPLRILLYQPPLLQNENRQTRIRCQQYLNLGEQYNVYGRKYAMSYTIEYDRQFIRSELGITPVWLSGDNNVTTGYGRRERRVRNWHVFMSLLACTKEELLAAVEPMKGGYQEHWKKGGRWVDDAGLTRWVENGCKAAASIEGIISQNCLSWIRCSLLDYSDGGYGKTTHEEKITTTEAFDAWIQEIKPLITTGKIYPIISFNSGEPIKHPSAKKQDDDEKVFFNWK